MAAATSLRQCGGCVTSPFAAPPHPASPSGESSGQRADGGKACRVGRQAPGRAAADAPEGNRAPAARPRESRPAMRPQRRRAGVARGGKGGRDEGEVAPQPPRPRHACPAMHRRGQHGPARAAAPRPEEGAQPRRRGTIRQVQPRPVLQCRKRRLPHQQHQPAPPAERRESRQHPGSRPPRQHPRPAREPRRRRPGIGQADGVGDQPEPRQGPAPRLRRLEPPRPDF